MIGNWPLLFWAGLIVAFWFKENGLHFSEVRIDN